MSYFTTHLSAQSHGLRLPDEHRADIERYVQQHQQGKVTAERAPFRRQIDLWAFAIATAIAKGLPPADEATGRVFVRTRDVQMSDDLCDLLAVLAFATLGIDDPKVDDPAAIIDVGNRFAAAGCPAVIAELADPNLRLTTLEKILDFAAQLYTSAPA